MSSVPNTDIQVSHEKKGFLNGLIEDRNRLGMILFLLSEVGFFGVLIASYVYFAAGNPPGPTAGTALDVQRTLIFSLFLFASSATIWLASRSLRRGSQAGLTFWLAVTVLFGAIFLTGQITEYIDLYTNDVTLARNLFGTSFFTLTGFHGLHVFAGLIAITILTGLSLAKVFKPPEAGAIESISLYWHFVDLVWVIIFSLVYLVPMFS